jgi:uncharacterized membrane protein HdeD (DUF308 family)
MKQHFDNISQKISRVIANWWLLLIVGILSAVAGVLVFVFPLESYVTLSIIFGAVMILVGASQLVIATSSNNYLMTRGYFVVGGVLDVILGLFLSLYPGVTITLLPILLGIWMLYHSFVIIAFGGDLETFNIGGQGLVVGSGILLLILSILILMNPFSAGIAAVVVLTGVGFLVFGAILIVLAFKLKDIHKTIQQ